MNDTGRVQYDASNPWAVFIGTQMNSTPGRIYVTAWAQRFGVNRDTVYRWLKGEVRHISDDTAAQVADAFGVEPSVAIEAARQARQSRLAGTTGSTGHRPTTELKVTPRFGVWLTRARQRAGFATSETLAAAADLDPDLKKAADLVFGWEQGRGRRPEVWEALALARVMRISEVDILAEAGWINLDPAARKVQRLVHERGVDDPDVAALRRFVENVPGGDQP